MDEEQDTEALVETLRHELTMCCADCNDGEGTLHEAWCGYRALDALAQRLAELAHEWAQTQQQVVTLSASNAAAEARATRAEAALRKVLEECDDDTGIVGRIVGAALAATPTEEP